MYVRGDEESVGAWVGIVHVSPHLVCLDDPGESRKKGFGRGSSVIVGPFRFYDSLAM
jgi:hypothetical protein